MRERGEENEGWMPYQKTVIFERTGFHRVIIPCQATLNSEQNGSGSITFARYECETCRDNASQKFFCKNSISVIKYALKYLKTRRFIE
jgi:hypothetical protein